MTVADRDEMEVWVAFLHAHSSIVRQLERELQAERNLPLAWLEVLMRLAAAPDGRMRMQELAWGVFISKSGLTRLADRIEAAGLIRRESCPSDRRGTLAVITESGRRTLRRAVPVHLRGVRSHFLGRLSPEHLEGLRAALARLGEAPVRTC